jgi:hypothetical protein
MTGRKWRLRMFHELIREVLQERTAELRENRFYLMWQDISTLEITRGGLSILEKDAIEICKRRNQEDDTRTYWYERKV